MEERREFIRIPTEAQVNIRPVPEGELKQGKSKNISGNGILISSEHLFAPGTILDIEVITPTHRDFKNVFEPLRARIQVVRSDGNHPPYDVAAEFIQMSLP